MGILLMLIGLLIIISVIVYIFRENKGTTWKEKIFNFIDFITDFAWLQLNFTTIFLIVGLALFLVGLVKFIE